VSKVIVILQLVVYHQSVHFGAKPLNPQEQRTQNHENEHVHSTGQRVARHRKCKQLKLGGSQAYHRSSD
jgi:hypothetical protein